MNLTPMIEGPLKIQGCVVLVTFYVADQMPVVALIGMDILSQFSSLQLCGFGPDLVVSLQQSNFIQRYHHLFYRPMSQTCLKDMEMIELIQLEDGNMPRRAPIPQFTPLLGKQIPKLCQASVVEK